MHSSTKERLTKSIKDFVETIVVSLLIALLIKTFLIDTRVVPTASMLPTIKLQDRLLVSKLSYVLGDVERGDIVVFKPPPGVNTPKSFFFPADLVKRVVGLPGETIEIKDEKVFINGRVIAEPYLKNKTKYTYGPMKIPQNKIFVLGDNRNASYDSHYWGFLSKDNVKGKAFAVYWPLNRLSILN